MKRLFVRPHARGLGLGYRLIGRLIEEAAEVGYSEMRLDVLVEFKKARKIYKQMGFAPAEPISSIRCPEHPS